jgi:hypothetical protein
MGDAEPTITLEEVYPLTLKKFQPSRDEHWNVTEGEAAYIARMKSGPLANWPEELLKEWLFRHASNMEDYAFLGFESLRFRKEVWDVDRFPGGEAFRDKGFCAAFQDVEVRAKRSEHDWLAHYMLKEGTWNTPIVLFENLHGDVKQLNAPLHLLEGHRRLSFLHGLKRLKRVQKEHSVWIASLG